MGISTPISDIQERECTSDHLLYYKNKAAAAVTKLIVKGLQYYGKVKKIFDSWFRMMYHYFFETGDIPTDKEKYIYIHVHMSVHIYMSMHIYMYRHTTFI